MDKISPHTFRNLRFFPNAKTYYSHSLLKGKTETKFVYSTVHPTAHIFNSAVTRYSLPLLSYIKEDLEEEKKIEVYDKELNLP